jgi:hypothetical protein
VRLDVRCASTAVAFLVAAGRLDVVRLDGPELQPLDGDHRGGVRGAPREQPRELVTGRRPG